MRFSGVFYFRAKIFQETQNDRKRKRADCCPLFFSVNFRKFDARDNDLAVV